jgi:putative flippase GtrA
MKLTARFRQPASFLIVGVANTLIGYSIILGALALGLDTVPANILGYAAGVLAGFMMNSGWTFSFNGPVVPALARYLLAFIAAWSLNIAIVLSLEAVAVSPYLAHAAGVPVYTVAFYLLSRHFVFR